MIGRQEGRFGFGEFGVGEAILRRLAHLLLEPTQRPFPLAGEAGGLQAIVHRNVEHLFMARAGRLERRILGGRQLAKPRVENRFGHSPQQILPLTGHRIAQGPGGLTTFNATVTPVASASP